MFHLWKKSIFARNYAHCRELASCSFLALEARKARSEAVVTPII